MSFVTVLGQSTHGRPRRGQKGLLCPLPHPGGCAKIVCFSTLYHFRFLGKEYVFYPLGKKLADVRENALVSRNFK